MEETVLIALSTKVGLLAVSLLSLVLLLIPETILALSPDVAVWITFIVLIGLTFFGWHQVRSKGENPWISPVFWYIPAVLIFQTTSIFIFYKLSVFVSNRLGLEGLYNFDALQPYFPKSCWLILLGAMGVFIGLNVPIRFLTKHIPPLNWDIDEKGFSLKAFLVLPFAVISFWVVTMPGAVPLNIQQIFICFGQMVMVFYIISIVQIYKGSKYNKRWKSILIIVLLCYFPSLLLGVRSAVVFPIIFFMWTYLAIRRKISKELLIGIIFFIFSFSITYPVISNFKYSVAGDKSTILDASRISMENVQIDKDITLLSFLEILRIQTLTGGNIIHYVQHFPDPFEYLKGESFIVVLGELVPRMIYPEKRSAGQYINRIVYDTGLGHEEHEVASSMFIDAISEFYINFGHIGVFLLSIVQGIYLHLKYDWLVRRSNFKIGFPIYAAGFIGPGAFTHLFVAESKAWIVWITVLWIVSRRTKGAEETGV